MKLLSLFILLLFFLFPAVVQSQEMGFGVGINPYDLYSSTSAKRVKAKDPLVEKIAEEFKADAPKLQKLYRVGYGYIELTKLLLISQKSGVDFDQIVELRKGKLKISQIAKKYKLDYNEINRQSHELKSGLESKLEGS